MAEGVESMKKGIHPTYQKTTVTCVNCGETFEVGSTAKEIRVEVCSQCHPFYTGKETYVQAAGRVERFKNVMVCKSQTRSLKGNCSSSKKEEPKVEKQLMQHLKDSEETEKLIKNIPSGAKVFFCI